MQQLEDLISVSATTAKQLQELRDEYDKRRHAHRLEYLAIEANLTKARKAMAEFLVWQLGESEARELGEALIGGAVKYKDAA